MSLVLLQEVAVASYGPLAAIGAGLPAVGAGIGIGIDRWSCYGSNGTSTRNARKNSIFCNCTYRLR